MIKGFIKNSILAGAVATAAFAGQIKVGSGANGINGLTGTAAGQYLNAGTACVGTALAQAGFSGCAAPVITGAGQRNYSTSLFSGSVPNQPGPTGENTALQLTASDGITYAMINNQSLTCNSANDGGCNLWSVQGNQSITIPIGIIGVTAAHIMLNDYWGVSGQQNTNVFLDFNTQSNGSGTVTTRAFNLVNGTEIRDATQCTTANAVGATNTCSTYAASTTSANTLSVFNGSYTNNTVAASPYFNTGGNFALDALKFTVNVGDQNLWLADIRITNLGGGTNISRTALSAITLEASATPEPATVFVLAGGLITLAFTRRRIAKASKIVL